MEVQQLCLLGEIRYKKKRAIMVLKIRGNGTYFVRVVIREILEEEKMELEHLRRESREKGNVG